MQDCRGQSSLHYLGFYPYLELVKVIINNGADLELKDNFGNAPLWYFVFNARGHYDFVELLIQNKANPNAINNAGRSPINFASQINDQRLIEILSK
jgi:ankyrin repeat protein